MTQERDPRVSIGRLLAILDDAHRLRSVIRQNSLDHELVTDGHTIHHMVDTSVFRLFTEPNRYAAIVSAFPSLFQPDEHADVLPGGQQGAPALHDPQTALRSLSEAAGPTLFATALLTGEGIFRFAAFARGEKQLLISPEHASEVHGYILDLARRNTRSGASRGVQRGAHDDYDALGRWLASEADNLRLHLNSDNDASLDTVRRGVVERLARVGGSPLLAEQRLASLFEKRRIGHAAEVLRFDLVIISPADKLIDEWKLRIRHAKRANRVQPNVHALEADAVTLAQLHLYNSEHRETRERCVLITDDRGLHRAYAAFLREHREDDRPDFPLRDPRQYMPVLNVGENTGGYIDPTVFRRVSTAIDRLLSIFPNTKGTFSGEPGAQVGLDVPRLTTEVGQWLAADDPVLQALTDSVENEIQEIGQAWLELLEYSLVAKSSIVLDLAATEMTTWKSVSNRMLKHEIGKQTEKIAKSFFQLTQSSTLLRLEVQAFEQRTRPTSINRRMLVSDFNQFTSEAFAGESLPEAVDKLRENPAASIKSLEGADRRERLLVIGCICLAVGAWAPARTLLEWADDPGGSAALDGEIRFFLSVSRRLAASHTNLLREYQAAEEALRSIDTNFPLQRARVRMETVALTLCRSAYLAFEREPFADEVRRAAIGWQRLAEGEGGRISGPQSEPAWRALAKQYVLNTFCLLFWIREAELDPPALLEETARELLEAMALPDHAYLGQGLHGEIFPTVARALLEPGLVDRDVARHVADLIAKQLARSTTPGLRVDLPYVDLIELRYMADALELRAEKY